MCDDVRRAGPDLRADRDQRRAVPRLAQRRQRLLRPRAGRRPGRQRRDLAGDHRRLPARAGHFGFLHIGFNMYLLWILGQMLEPSLGKLRFGAIYFTSLLTGSFGAILLSSPNSYTVGASGAVFGLMGAGVVFLHARGINPMESGLGPTILINLLFPFLFPGLNVSIGGHIGGLVGGVLSGWIITRANERRMSVGAADPRLRGDRRDRARRHVLRGAREGRARLGAARAPRPAPRARGRGAGCAPAARARRPAAGRGGRSRRRRRPRRPAGRRAPRARRWKS